MNHELYTRLEERCPNELFTERGGPVTLEETQIRIARYATLLHVNRNTDFSAKRLLHLAKGDYSASFMAEVQRARSGQYKDYGGLNKGDIELAAIEAGEGTYEVYEMLWPFEPEETEKALAEVTAA